MMKAKTRLSVAVRLPSGKIALKTSDCPPLSRRYPFLAWPFLRGPVVLVETMVLGIKALAFSASQIMEDEGEQVGSWALFFTMLGAFVFGMGLFVALPHVVTWLLGEYSPLRYDVRSLSFHVIDGIIKMLIFVGYIWAISLMDQIKRVFAYHGAEHKTIHCLESGQPLSVENARKFSRLHNRCGTTFLLLVLAISIAAFAIIFPLLPPLTESVWLNQTLQILLKILCMFPLAGLAYELIKFAAKREKNPLCRVTMWPGRQLQKLTTREPDDSMLETAIAALEGALSTNETTEEVQMLESHTLTQPRQAMAL